MKKVLYYALALSASGPAALFAQEGANNPIDLSAAGTAVENMQTAFTGLINTKVIVAAVAVVGVLVGLWCIPKIPRWIGMGRK